MEHAIIVGIPENPIYHNVQKRGHDEAKSGRNYLFLPLYLHVILPPIQISDFLFIPKFKKPHNQSNSQLLICIC